MEATTCATHTTMLRYYAGQSCSNIRSNATPGSLPLQRRRPDSENDQQALFDRCNVPVCIWSI